MKFLLEATSWYQVARDPSQRQYLESLGLEFNEYGIVTEDEEGNQGYYVIELDTLEQLIEFTEKIDEECIIRDGYLYIYNDYRE